MSATAKQCCRPTLEALETRDMMDAGIGGALMHQLTNLGQGAQIHLLAQGTSPLQNQNNPLSQSLTQPGQALMVQGQQLNAELHAVADHIFSDWSHHTDRVVHTIPGHLGSAFASYPASPKEFNEERAAHSALQDFDDFFVHQGQNIWGFKSIKLNNFYAWESSGHTWHLNVLLGLHTEGGEHAIVLEYAYDGKLGNYYRFQLADVRGCFDLPFLELAIKTMMDTECYEERS